MQDGQPVLGKRKKPYKKLFIFRDSTLYLRAESEDSLVVVNITLGVYDYREKGYVVYFSIWNDAGLRINIFNLTTPSSGKTKPASLGDGAITQVFVVLNVVLLQATMSLRVYVLFEKSKRTLLVIGPCFFITQGIAITLTCLSLAQYADYWRQRWREPLASTFALVFEVILCVFSLRYVAKNIPASLWITPRQGARNLARFITVLFVMTGPWMVISLQKSYAKALETKSAGSSEFMTGMVFARAQQDVEGQQSGNLTAISSRTVA
ncbi:hypothetical protein CONPUDRAFT_73377 [Coniophora puteana RWD-64-598 SS2]|uniref:Uncharacterized protein n=1 Tax=Coniophora puteana (strain RWD-64-598) TaxID=741705 RepID=A0A5M3MN95_CONPW|nr:uncharacterized protein CONPUDRAFT_73377 [Coniophora puteana RWD-64-598 SS2]EIW80195.1 hypothetical protein CONPUDRAFT_73377 [Coniophora puteana RWD-64-598 SS2]